MTCTEYSSRIVEQARGGARADVALAAHVAKCPACAERWALEQDLTAHFAVMRAKALAPRLNRDARRESLMIEFSRRNPPRVASHRWLWALSAAATAVLAVGGLRMIPERPVLMGMESPVILLSRDAAQLSGEDFIAVPYAPPLAEGEIVRVVRTELYPGALATMGIVAHPEWWPGDSGNLTAEVVVGQDGFPRAVRYAGNSETTDFE